MTPADVARENPVGALFAALSVLAWAAVVLGAGGVLGVDTRGLIRVTALAVVVSAFAVGFLARTVGERYR